MEEWLHEATCWWAVVIFCGLLLSAQQPKPGVLSNDVLKKVVPGTYFFRGESAPVQLRNSAGFSVPDGKLVLIGLVDISGYAADVQAVRAKVNSERNGDLTSTTA